MEDAKRLGIRKGIVTGAMVGFLFLVIYCAYALGFWYGWTLSQSGTYTIGRILLVFFSVIVGVFSLGRIYYFIYNSFYLLIFYHYIKIKKGNVGPFISTLATARAAAFEVFKIIDRVSTLN